MEWLKDRLKVLIEAKSNIRLLYAAIAVLLAAIVAQLQLFSKIQKWFGFAEAGKMTVLGVPIVAYGITISGLLFGWWMLEHAVTLRRRLKPKLSIAYDDRAPDCHKTVEIGNDIPRPHGRSIRLRVTCNSDVNVEQCSGFLTKIQYRAHGGQFSDEALFEPTYLDWTFPISPIRPFSPITIYPRVPRYLGICMTNEKKDGFRIQTTYRSFVTPEWFNKIGEYKIHVEIVGARVPTISRVMLITWNGKWNEIKARMEHDSD